jgi:heavy metal translocating P-type ATPase
MPLDLTIAALAYTGVRLAERMRRGRRERQERQQQADVACDGAARAPLTAPRTPRANAATGALTIASGALRILHPVPGLAALNIAAYAYTMLPFYRNVEHGIGRLLRERKVDSYLLMGIGNVLLLGSGRFVTADIGVVLGNYFEQLARRAKGTSERHLSAHLFERLLDPQQAVWVVRDGVELEVRLAQVHVGDVLLARSGETLAADGVVVDGMASVDQHAFTGESYPVEKGVGEPVYASTLVLTGELKVRVQRSGQDTAIARIGAILEDSMTAKTQAQLRAEQWADRANLPFLGLAGLGFLVSGPVGAMVILGGNTVQAMQMLAPLAMINYQSLAARRAILLKNGAALEQVGGIDTVLFDKTGTLTDGELQVSDVHVLAGAGRTAVLADAALAERRLSHPIARAIVAAAEDAGIAPAPGDDHEVRLGFGVMVRDAGRSIRVGSGRFMGAEGIAVPTAARTLEQAIHRRGHSLVLVAVDTAIVGVIELKARLRPEVPAVIARLREQGVRHIAIVSGDHAAPTRQLGAEIGADEVFAEVLPEQKADIVRRCKEGGQRVCFVGDGVNDALAMQAADLSISLSGATTLAQDMADIVLLEPELTRLNTLFELSRRLDANLKRGLGLCVTGMGIVVAGSLLVHMDILVAMGVHAVLGSTAIGNSMLPLLEGRSRPGSRGALRPADELPPGAHAAEVEPDDAADPGEAAQPSAMARSPDLLLEALRQAQRAA